MIKLWDIHGGIHPPENKTQSLQEPLGHVEIPSQLIFPLSQHIGEPAEPIVSVGQKVLAGEIIARAIGPISVPVHASTSGTVTAIERRTIAHPSGMQDECILIEPDFKDEWIELSECLDYTQLPIDEILEKIRHAGIAGMGGAGFPTAIKLHPRGNKQIDTLIINGTECEPYITADDMLMQLYADEIVEGINLIGHLLGSPQHIFIGIEDNKPEAITAMEAAVKGSNITVQVFPTKYPSGGEKQLIQILTGKEVPHKKLPADIGIVCQNIATTRAVWRAVRYGEPLTKRITTVVGEALGLQRNIEVSLGTPIDHILDSHGLDENTFSRLIMGGPMMGFTLESAQVPVVKTTNCILAPSNQELPPPPPAQACIRCGLCSEACPVSLLPQQLYWYSKGEDYERLEAHNLDACIECGACSYVCPSNIPLVQYFRASKGTIRQMEADKEFSDHSRKRYEFRQQRLEHAEAEKEAKRIARKKAAEEAKKKLEKIQTASSPAKENTEMDLVAQAMARVKSKQSSPEEQQARLERAVSSAENKLERAQKRLTEIQNDDSTQLETLQARVKEAESKLEAAREKLLQFNTAEAENPDSKKIDSTRSSPNQADIVNDAIAKAQAKMAMTPVEKLNSNIESLQRRLAKAEKRFQEKSEAGEEDLSALKQNIDKLNEKIITVTNELLEAQKDEAENGSPVKGHDAKTEDAANTAIEKAKAKAAAQSNMTPAEKLQAQVDSLETRLKKAQSRLEKAIDEGDPNKQAFETSVKKLETKIAETKEKLNS